MVSMSALPAAAPSLSQVTAAAPPQRVLAVDVLRGLTIALMILVNDPGDWTRSYAQLDHARWNGFTLTDLVFPTFLFLVGLSTILSLETRIARGASRAALARNIVRRAATIFLIDLFIAAFPFFHLTHLRIYGVLTRIALCYLVVGLLCLVTRRAAVLFGVAAALLIGYWLLMRFVPVPGFGVPTHNIPLLDPDRNLVAVWDRAITAWTQRTLHTGVLYEHTRDPEGLLSTPPAIATTLIGTLTALWLRRVETVPELRTPRSITPQACLRGLLLGSVVCLDTGRLWNLIFPINKRLWTSSYVLYAAGLSLLGLALCYWAVDILRLQHRSPAARAALWPWLVFGSNAITAYAFAELLVEVLANIRVRDAWTPGHPANVMSWTYRHVFARSGSTVNTSLVFALAYVLICFIPNLILWRKRIFLKV